MKWSLVSRQDHRRASARVGSGVIVFVAAGLAGSLAVPPGTVFWAIAGFVSLVLCVRRALRLWRVDEMVFDHRRPGKSERPVSALTFRSVREPERARQLHHV